MSEPNADAARKAAKRAYKARDYETAVSLMAPLVALTPATPEEGAADLAAYATALTSLSRLDEAADHMAKAVALSPDDARLRSKSGEILARAGRHVDAAEQFRQLTELEPGSPDNWVRLASELNILGLEAETEDALARCLAIDPNHAEAQILQLERSLTADPERDGLAEEAEIDGARFETSEMRATSANWTGPKTTQPSPPIRHRVWMIAIEAVALLMVALWVQSLFL